MQIMVTKNDGSKQKWDGTKINKMLAFVTSDPIKIGKVSNELQINIRDGITTEEIQQTLIQTADNLTIEDERYKFIAGKLLFSAVNKKIQKRVFNKFIGIDYTPLLFEKITKTHRHLINPIIFNTYTDEEIKQCINYINLEKDFEYSLNTLLSLTKIFLNRDEQNELIEFPQEKFLLTAMTLASIWEDKLEKTKYFYEVLSEFYATLGTPALVNLSHASKNSSTSCEILTFPDNLEGIHQVLSEFAIGTSRGVGYGGYLGHIGGRGRPVRGIPNISKGTLPYIKEFDIIASFITQGDTRFGNIALYQDIFHIDVEMFLNLENKSGDPTFRAYNIFRAVNVPDFFFERVRNDEKWTLFEPYSVFQATGVRLQDLFGEEFKKFYEDLETQNVPNSKTVSARDLYAAIMDSYFNSGKPYIFKRDIANKHNPNKHLGNIYSSNLCAEIVGIQEPIEYNDTEYNDTHFSPIYKTGLSPTCNLISPVIPNIMDNPPKTREKIYRSIAQMVYSLVKLTHIPNISAKRYNDLITPVGIGLQGYAYELAKNDLIYGSDEALKYTDEFMSELTNTIVDEMSEIAQIFGSYKGFEGSEWQKGNPPIKLSDKIKDKITQKGLAVGTIFAIAPNTGTSILADTTPSIFPIKSLVQKKDTIFGQVTFYVPAFRDHLFAYQSSLEKKLDYDRYLKTVNHLMQYVDQSISAQLWFYSGINEIKQLSNTILNLDKYDRIKTLYYMKMNSIDQNQIEDETGICIGCAG